MEAGLIELVRVRRGHFELGTGYHGDVWLDLDGLFLRPALLQPHIDSLAEQLREHPPEAVCGPMEGGASFDKLDELMDKAGFSRWQ